jgi:hypothetical protein
VLPRKATPVAVVDGDLERVRGERVRDNRRIYAELRMYAFSRNYQNGWAAHKYRAIFGEFPPWAWNGDKLLVPSAETVGLIKHLQIKWAKARAKEQRAAFSAT